MVKYHKDNSNYYQKMLVSFDSKDEAEPFSQGELKWKMRKRILLRQVPGETELNERVASGVRELKLWTCRESNLILMA